MSVISVVQLCLDIAVEVVVVAAAPDRATAPRAGRLQMLMLDVDVSEGLTSVD